MSSAPDPAEIVKDARWLAQALDVDSRLMRLVDMSPEDYRSASFLDDRLLGTNPDSPAARWDDVVAAIRAGARRDARWIFHIGHVGSTLVSRLLGELDSVLALREPRLLRDLAIVPAERRAPFTGPATALMSRTFAPSELALVKATSMASEIAAELVPAGERALVLYAAPRAYLGTILAGENSLKELAMLASHRARRMAGRVAGLDAADASEAHTAAAAWACEMTALEAAADAMGDRRLMWADFDAALGEIEPWLADTAAFFGFEAPAERLRAIAGGPLPRRYSKALEYEYSPDLRRELLGEALDRHNADVEGAMAMLRTAAGQSPLLKRALSRCQEDI